MHIKNLLPRLCVAAALAVACLLPLPCAAGASAATAAQGEAKTFTHEAGGITFALPEGWAAEPDGDQLTAGPADHGLAVVFWVAAEDDFEDAAKALGAELGKRVKDLKFDADQKEDTHNGMPHSAVTGSGQVGGRDIIFSADLLQAKRPVIVLSFGSPENFKKHGDEYAQLVKSIKKVG